MRLHQKAKESLIADKICRPKPLPVNVGGFPLSVHPSPRGEGKQGHCF